MRRKVHARRGSTMVESAMVATVFLLLLVAIMEGGRLGLAYNSISFVAHRAARFAAVRGAVSGHPVSAADVRRAALGLVVLDPANFTVTTTWSPDNHPGSTVQVTVAYRFRTLLVPLGSDLGTLSTTAREVITQ